MGGRWVDVRCGFWNCIAQTKEMKFGEHSRLGKNFIKNYYYKKFRTVQLRKNEIGKKVRESGTEEEINGERNR